MPNPGKLMFSFFVLMTVVMYTVYSSNIRVADIRRDEYKKAIMTASQLATMDIIDASDINKTYDGVRTEAEDVPINFDTLDQFRATLFRLLESKRSSDLDSVSKFNVPLVGYVTYDYIVGVTYGDAYSYVDTVNGKEYTYEQYLNLTQAEKERVKDANRGKYLMPMGYTLYVSGGAGTLSNKTWNFTLGNVIKIANSSGGYDSYEGDGVNLYKLNEKGVRVGSAISAQDYLSSIGFETLKQLSEYVVMASINEYLNAYTGVGFNQVSDNTNTSLSFDLNKSNYSTNMRAYNSNSTVIDGPGMFAVIDLYKGSDLSGQVFERIASFGGSELVLVTDK